MEPREFRYLPHIRWFQYPVVIGFTALFVVPSLLLAFAFGDQGHLSLPPLLFGLGMGALTLILFFTYRSLATAQVTLDDDGIRYVNFKKDLRIEYGEIDSLSFPSIPYLGGWMKIGAGDRSMRLTAVLEDLDELVELLKQKLDEQDNSSVCDRAKLFQFYKTAGITNRSWQRSYELTIPAVLATILVAVGWGLGGPTFDQLFTFGNLLLLFGSLIWPWSGWMLAELALTVSLVRGSDEEAFALPERDPLRERRFLVAGYAVSALILAAGYLTSWTLWGY